MFHSEKPVEPRGLTPGRTRNTRVVAREQKAVLAKLFNHTELGRRAQLGAKSSHDFDAETPRR